jgi:putative nucleotidyltransferase with HDIG domain
MLTQRLEEIAAFTRRDVARLGIAAGVLVLGLTLIFLADFFPQKLEVAVGTVAKADILAPRADVYVSAIETAAAQKRASDAVDPQYDYSTERAIAIANRQVQAFGMRVAPIDEAFKETVTDTERPALLDGVLPGDLADGGISDADRETLLKLSPERWVALRAEASRVLDLTERTDSLRETDIPQAQFGLSRQMVGGPPALNDAERRLAADIIAPLIVPNSSFSQALTDQAKEAAVAAVAPVMVPFAQGEKIVGANERITDVDFEAIQYFGLTEARADFARLGGWFFLSIMLVGLLLAWLWRFRRDLWHRNNAMLLISVIVIGVALMLKATAGRPGLAFVVPTAVAGILLAILLDAGVATTVVIVLSMIAGAVNGNSLELTAYALFGGLAGVVAIRRGDRLQIFVQAGLAVAVANVLVVSTFAMLGLHDVRGLLELVGASFASAAGSAVAAVGSFAVLGNLFGILTVFQLLELANPSQPLLRRLLVETPGTYHHSLMVGNLAERAAEAIGADPLLTRVAAYYHDVGKLANPLAFIENQAGGENIHDELDPEVSAQILKQHVADGIDIAYKSRLPKTLIAFIPQHHGTAIMSYFYERAKRAAAEPFGGPQTADGAAAAAAIDERKFRHVGPKPQSREAALIMLADGVEASVRSLASRDEPAIRAMVARIIEERLSDGQFDECDLTLRDVERIKEAFVAQLLGMYHQRIAYPQNKIVEIESRRGTGTGTGA